MCVYVCGCARMRVFVLWLWWLMWLWTSAGEVHNYAGQERKQTISSRSYNVLRWLQMSFVVSRGSRRNSCMYTIAMLMCLCTPVPNVKERRTERKRERERECVCVCVCVRVCVSERMKERPIRKQKEEWVLRTCRPMCHHGVEKCCLELLWPLACLERGCHPASLLFVLLFLLCSCLFCSLASLVFFV